MCDGEGGGSGGVAAARAAEVVSARASGIDGGRLPWYGGRRYRPPTILQQRRWLTKRRWSHAAAGAPLL